MNKKEAIAIGKILATVMHDQPNVDGRAAVNSVKSQLFELVETHGMNFERYLEIDRAFREQLDTLEPL